MNNILIRHRTICRIAKDKKFRKELDLFVEDIKKETNKRFESAIDKRFDELIEKHRVYNKDVCFEGFVDIDRIVELKEKLKKELRKW